MVFSFLADGARAATAALILSAIGRGAIESPVCVAPGWSRRPSTARLPRRTGPSSHLALQQPSNTRTSDHNLGSYGRAHPVVRTLVWRPLTVGLIHGLAGSGALTAIAFAWVPGCRGAAPVHDPFRPEVDRRDGARIGRRRGHAARHLPVERRAPRPGSGHSGLSITVGVMGSIRHGRGGEWRRRPS